MQKKSKKCPVFLQKRLTYRQSVPSSELGGLESSEAVALSEKPEPNLDLKSASEKMKTFESDAIRMQASLEDQIMKSALPEEQKAKYKAQLEGSVDQLIKGQVQLTNELGMNISKHLAELTETVEKGKLNTKAAEGLENALEGLKTQQALEEVRAAQRKGRIQAVAETAGDAAVAGGKAVLKTTTQLGKTALVGSAELIGTALGSIAILIKTLIKVASKQ